MSTTAQRQTGNNSNNNLKREMVGITLLGSSLLLGGGLISLQAGDGKLMGPFGQLLALALYALLGMGSYLLILGLLSVAYGIFTNRFDIRDIRLWVGYIGASITGTVLMFLMFPSYRLSGFSSGGKTGEFIGNIGISLFSKVGTFLITSTFMILFLVVATQSSPVKGAREMGKITSGIFKFIWGGALVVLKGIVSLFAWEASESEYVESSEEVVTVNQDSDINCSNIENMENPEQETVETEDLSSEKIEPALKPEEATVKSSNVEDKYGEPTKIIGESTKNKGDCPEKKIHSKSKSIVKKEKSPRKDLKIAKNSDVSDLDKVIERDVDFKDSMPALTPMISEMETASDSLEKVEQFEDEKGEFKLPDPDVLHYEKPKETGVNKEVMLALSKRMVGALEDYKIKGTIKEIHPGPVVTMYEFAPEAGVRVSKIESLNKDLALTLAATRVRIVAPIPGKAAVGIEVPNKKRQTVFIKEGIADNGFKSETSKLTMVLGKDIKGKNIFCDLSKAPHLLVAGATGSGKSVGVNAMIMSILFRATPRDVRFIMIDPKMVELSIYNDIPHLLLPVVTDPRKASIALQWAVKEMERRYMLLSDLKVRNLDDYNNRIEELGNLGIESPEHLPRIVVVIDEFADLMMVAAKDVEIAVARIAQKARAVGIHLIVATQRPSTDVITGLIKSNFPTRIAYMVSSRIDSKVVLDKHGAETLLGNGDMLYSNRGLEPVRVHGSYVSTSEIQKVVDHLRSQGEADYDLSITEVPPEEMPDMEDEPYDTKWDLALDIISRDRIASISYLQRKLKIGYNRSARMIERMQAEGIISPPNGTNQREILISTPPD